MCVSRLCLQQDGSIVGIPCFYRRFAIEYEISFPYQKNKINNFLISFSSQAMEEVGPGQWRSGAPAVEIWGLFRGSEGWRLGAPTGGDGDSGALPGQRGMEEGALPDGARDGGRCSHRRPACDPSPYAASPGAWDAGTPTWTRCSMPGRRVAARPVRLLHTPPAANYPLRTFPMLCR